MCASSVVAVSTGAGIRHSSLWDCRLNSDSKMIFEYFRHPDRVLPVIDRAHDLEDQRPTAADRREAARLDEARKARDPRVKLVKKGAVRVRVFWVE
jgi:hypothetical protein